MRRKAFTLIELLVVISIIAILISIMIPALQSAKQVARRVLCGANQKSLGTGIYVYAQSNDGSIPRSQYDPKATDAQTASGTDIGYNPVNCYVMFYVKKDANTISSPKQRIFSNFVNQGKWGFGELFMNDTIEEGEVFYCPSAPRKYGSGETPFNYDAYSQDGNIFPAYSTVCEQNGVNGNRTRSSYMYVPQHSKNKVALRTPGPTSDPYYPDIAKKVQELSSTKLMGCDYLFNLDNVAHKKGKNKLGVNGLFGDGSVTYCNNPDAFSNDLWMDASGRPVPIYSSEWRFRMIIDFLEK